MTNTENISKLLKLYIDYLTQIARYLDERRESTLHNFFDTARNYRESFISASSGPIKAEYVFTVDIADKPGRSLPSLLSLPCTA